MCATAASIIDSLSPVQRCWTSAALTISDTDLSFLGTRAGAPAGLWRVIDSAQ